MVGCCIPIGINHIAILSNNYTKAYFELFCFYISILSHLKLSITFHVVCIHILWITEKKRFIVAWGHFRQVHEG